MYMISDVNQTYVLSFILIWTDFGIHFGNLKCCYGQVGFSFFKVCHFVKSSQGTFKQNWQPPRFPFLLGCLCQTSHKMHFKFFPVSSIRKCKSCTIIPACIACFVVGLYTLSFCFSLQGSNYSQPRRRRRLR